ncbi:glycosyltransferase family 4 protein [Crocosphaera chwakensis]|uniref:Glycosyltransferase n=1 Tax=Crocosphaera chwakensis CCY0110 TaxID=391612 RepID=A3IVZ9_9CHRO|nr:glycosyltransferase family 4 protein [Crocosphaera chwakensis]EAZ89310.1 glycosyltransferase [Crocosphaera chwakensis CCY0110]
MILYVSKNLTHLSGLSQAGQDILIALLATEDRVKVVTETKCSLPQEVNNQVLSSPQWIVFKEKIYPPKPIKRKLQIPIFLIQSIKKKYSEITQAKRQQQLQKYDYSPIIVNGFTNHRFLENVAPKIKGKKVIIIHESPRHFLPPNTYTVNDALQIMNQYDSLIFVSSRCRDEWSSLADLSNQRIYYIPNCCKEDEIHKITLVEKAEIKQKLRLATDQFLAVCVASLQPRKNQKILLDVFPQLKTIMPNLKLFLIGPISLDSFWGKSLLEQIKSKELSEHIEYLGTRDNAKEFIYAADVLLLPSLAEAMPCVILEAMALKTPVIASNVDGISELIQNNHTGFLFSPKEPQSLVESFKKMANDLDQTKKYTEYAYEKYWTQFSRLKQIERYAQFIANFTKNS